MKSHNYISNSFPANLMNQYEFLTNMFFNSYLILLEKFSLYKSATRLHIIILAISNSLKHFKDFWERLNRSLNYYCHVHLAEIIYISVRNQIKDSFSAKMHGTQSDDVFEMRLNKFCWKQKNTFKNNSYVQAIKAALKNRFETSAISKF
jgi:hypothetical protein